MRVAIAPHAAVTPTALRLEGPRLFPRVSLEFSTGAGELAVFNSPLDVGRRMSECAGTGVRGDTDAGDAWKPSVGVLQSMHSSDRGSSVDKVATATAKVTSITISPQAD